MEGSDRIGGSSGPSRSFDRRAARRKKAESLPFDALLHRRVEEAVEAHGNYDEPSGPLEELLDEIRELGSRLVANPTVETVRRYRQVVGAVLKRAVSGALAVRESSSGGNILRRKRFSTITVVNEKLEKLAAAVLASQKEQFDILRRVEEINGLLVDLLQ